MAPTPVTVAAAHAAPVFLDRDRTVEKAVGIIEDAGRAGVQFLVFPEAFLPGFPYWINLTSVLHQQPLYVRLWEQAVDLAGDPAPIRPLQEAARRAGCVVVMGLNERSGGTLYNAQAFIDADGAVLGWRRKLVPTLAERTVWGYGDGSTLRTWDTAVGRVGGLMCWEHTMNLARQALIVDGIQLHASAWPSLATLAGFDQVFIPQVEAMTKNHALTGQCVVVVAMNPVTQDVFDVLEPVIGPTELMTTGPAWSAVLHPMAFALAEERGEEERLVTATVDLADLVGTKYFVDTAGHYSRPEVLSLHVDRRAFRPAEVGGAEADGAGPRIPAPAEAVAS